MTKKKNSNLIKKFTSKGIVKWAAAIVIVLSGTVLAINSFAAPAVKPVTPNSRFAWKLQGAPDPNVMDGETGPKVYDFDYLESSPSNITELKAKGITVICYFSAGTDEDWRPDHNLFKSGDTFGQLPGWDGELIVDTRSSNVRQIMYNRIETMSNLGCDGIEPDNIDAYTNSSSIPLNETTSLDYMQFLSDTAHSFNMSIALKNAGDLINKKLPNGKTVLQAFDFALVEQCYQYNECDAFKPFIDAGKAVFIVEYKGSASTWATSSQCTDANANNFDAYLMNLNLNGPRTACRTSGGTSVTPPSNSPPAVNFTSPSNNQQFAADSAITLKANASDTDGQVEQVQFYNDTALLAADTTAPYMTTVENLSPGTYTFRVVATDNSTSDNNTAMAAVTVTVLEPAVAPPSPNAPPIVTIQGPTNTVQEPASFTLRAAASDSDGSIAKVEFFNGTSKIGQDASEPYSFAISSYPAGTYKFSARAYDDKGAIADSDALTVIVTVTVTPSDTAVVNGAPYWPENATIEKDFHSTWWSNKCAFRSSCKIYIHWPKAKDNKRVVGYEIWRSKDGEPFKKLYKNSASDRYWTEKLSKETKFFYKVYALDSDGNKSPGLTDSVTINCPLMNCSVN